MLKLYVLGCFFLANGYLCYQNTADWGSPALFPTFMLNLVCILIGFYQALSLPKLNLDSIIWIFVYMFFFLAPVIQLNFSPYFPNTLPIEIPYVIKANIIIFVWNLLYLLFRQRKPGAAKGWEAAEADRLQPAGASRFNGTQERTGGGIGATAHALTQSISPRPHRGSANAGAAHALTQSISPRPHQGSANAGAAFSLTQGVSPRPTAGAESPSPLHFVGSKVRVAYFMAAALIFLATIALFKQEFFLGLADYGRLVSNKSILLLVNISFQGIVFANWLFALDRWKSDRRIPVLLVLAVSSVMMINQLSPFNTSRFYIGFCLILIIYVFYSKTMRPAKFIWIMFSGLLFVFPLFNMFRYGITGFEMPPFYDLMFDQLTELHFDAFSNLIATLQFTETSGLSYGHQLLGVLFFFVPRNVWAGKPLSSGEAVGDFIGTRYELQMTNLSNPIPSEFYINFGWVGVVAGALFIAWLVNRLEAKEGGNSFTHSLIAGYLFIIFRGDMMNAFAYCFGTYTIMVLIPTLMSKLDRSAPTAAAGSAGNPANLAAAPLTPRSPGTRSAPAHLAIPRKIRIRTLETATACEGAAGREDSFWQQDNSPGRWGEDSSLPVWRQRD